MKQTVLLTILVTAIFALASCATSTTYEVEPAGGDSTLVIGQISLEFTGFPSALQINGSHGSGLKLTFVDEYGNDFSVTAYGKEALFGFEADSPTYRLVKIGFSNSRVRATIGMNWALDVEPGKVNNLGKVEGEWRYYGPSNDEVLLLPPGGHNDLEKYFRERYPMSGWNEIPWTGVGFYLPK